MGGNNVISVVVEVLVIDGSVEVWVFRVVVMVVDCSGVDGDDDDGNVERVVVCMLLRRGLMILCFLLCIFCFL